MLNIRPLRTLAITVTLFVIAAFGLSTARDYQLSRQEAESGLLEISRLMEEHTRAALLTGFLQISRAAEVAAGRRPEDMGGDQDRAALARLGAGLPFADSIWVFDAAGTARASSHKLPATPLSASDRAYFTALRDGAKEFVSPLIWGRVISGSFVALSRRLEDADGHFLGGIEVSIRSSYFTDFYRTLHPDRDAVFAIYKDDGSLVMRSTLPPGQEHFPVPSQLLERLPHSPTGAYTTRSEQDGIRRLYAYRRLPDQPLVVVAGLPVDHVFAAWRERSARNAFIAAALLAAFLHIAQRLAGTLRREADLRSRAEGLLAEKDVLFQEIHHRVKNNLQIIASFLTMQAVRAGDPKVSAAFEEALTRLQSMALVHQILYEQNEATEVSMAGYLRALSASIGQTYGADERAIHIRVDTDDTRLPLDQAVPLALLANEALTNALKHAYPPGRSGEVRVRLARDGTGLAFSLSDDGIGMTKTPGSGAGLGMTILNALARQLGGHLSWGGGTGTSMTVHIPA
jgi:two-component sensor histidine kinase